MSVFYFFICFFFLEIVGNANFHVKSTPAAPIDDITVIGRWKTTL